MTDLPSIMGAYGVGALGLVGYAISLARRERQARERRTALDRQRARLLGIAQANHAAGAGRPGTVPEP